MTKIVWGSRVSLSSLLILVAVSSLFLFGSTRQYQAHMGTSGIYTARAAPVDVIGWPLPYRWRFSGGRKFNTEWWYLTGNIVVYLTAVILLRAWNKRERDPGGSDSQTSESERTDKLRNALKRGCIVAALAGMLALSVKIRSRHFVQYCAIMDLSENPDFTPAIPADFRPDIPEDLTPAMPSNGKGSSGNLGRIDGLLAYTFPYYTSLDHRRIFVLGREKEQATKVLREAIEKGTLEAQILENGPTIEILRY